MDPALIVAALAFFAIAGAGLAFSSNGADTSKATKRAKELAGKRGGRRSESDTATAKRRATTQEALKELSANEKQSRKRRVSVSGLIEQSGLSLSEGSFWIGSAVIGLVLAGVGFLIHQSLIGVAAGAIIGGLGLPRWVLKFLIGMRQKKFTNQLADAIDVIVRGVKGGLPLNQCLRIISTESPEPARSEFRNIVDASAMGVPLDQNLMRLYERMPLPEVNFFAIVLIIQQKTGGNLSESLGNLSSVLRARKLMRAKVSALSSEAKASAGIIGSLPFIVVGLVYMIRPEYMTTLFVHPTGHLLLLIAAVMMSTGILVMRNMINFKF
ncbi:MAG: type II secretion system F family protein [Hyphomonadaceae bacterium]